MSRTSPSWSTARQRYMRTPAIRITISLECRRPLGRGRRLRQRRAELQHPTPHRFIGDVEPALGEQFLYVAVAQREAEIEPDRVLDDLGRKTMAAIAERSHAATLTLRAALARPVSVTKPLRRLRLTAVALAG